MFSWVVFITFTVELLFGLYILNLNPKGKLNRHFFSIAMVLCIWSFGFAMALMQENIENAIVWRRFSGIGRISLYAVLLHMMIVLSGKRDVLKKGYLYLLYAPALILLGAFSLYGEIANTQYNLVQTVYGWVNTGKNNIWDISFTFYYVACVLISVYLVTQWKRNATDEKVRKQANVLIFTFLVTVVFGTLTDVFLNHLSQGGTP